MLMKMNNFLFYNLKKADINIEFVFRTKFYVCKFSHLTKLGDVQKCIQTVLAMNLKAIFFFIF